MTVIIRKNIEKDQGQLTLVKNIIFLFLSFCLLTDETFIAFPWLIYSMRQGAQSLCIFSLLTKNYTLQAAEMNSDYLMTLIAASIVLLAWAVSFALTKKRGISSLTKKFHPYNQRVSGLFMAFFWVALDSSLSYLGDLSWLKSFPSPWSNPLFFKHLEALWASFPR